MRFVELDKSEQTYCESVLKLGCGPAFVRTRADAFEKMIKEQGLQFWFRFWLNFTQNHGIKEFDEIDKDVPGLIPCLFKGLHYHFVQATSEDAITYCWNIIFANGAPTKRIVDEMYQFLEIAFGCALSEVFFKWLYAEEVGPHCKKRYWNIPQKYLEPDFKPGLLEAFLVCEWGNKFVELLGVNRNLVPWVKKLFQIPVCILDEGKGMSVYHLEYTKALFVKKCVEAWKLKIKNMRAALQQADCKKMDENFSAKKVKKGKVRFLLSTTEKPLDAGNENDKEKEKINSSQSMIHLKLKEKSTVSSTLIDIFHDLASEENRKNLKNVLKET